MRKLGLIGLALVAPGGIAAVGSAEAADMYKKAPYDCKAPDAPYKHYECLDKYLGDGFFERLVNYYRLEWGHEVAPADPKALPVRRDGWPGTPQSTPPMPFTEWPYGGNTYIGVTRPNAVDSPLMVALANTDVGKALNDANIQIYGWVNPGGNLSTSTTKPGGNFPAAYMYTPNTATLDQAVVYIERVPDTVQTDHVDWGFRVSGIYGENYRYTTTFGESSYQLTGHNLINGYDYPMIWGELYIPNIGEGMLVRLGRFISIPDTEAQLAPNNYMYSHSMTYAYDNYTNHGLLATTALTKNWQFQIGVVIGTDSAPWHWGQTVTNPFPNVAYPGTTMLKDPGSMPSLTTGLRWTSNSGNDAVYLVADGINSGAWGYNNLQWLGGTYYHKFNEQWHITFESYTLSERNVLNGSGNNATANTIIANGGFPFTPANGFNFNAPNFAQCKPTQVTCDARDFTALSYLNWKFSPLDNLSFRVEYFNDMQGQRTGTKTQYFNQGIGWQHWLSPQVELRPEIAYYHSINANAFNGNLNAGPAAACGNTTCTIAPNKNFEWIASADLIWHF